MQRWKTARLRSREGNMIIKRMICDGCEKEFEEHYTSKRDYVERARIKGWKTLGNYHFCEECARKKGLIK